MSQQRITLFYPVIASTRRTSPNAKCHFLELPFSIRRQIYHEAGIVSSLIIDMNYWATRHNPYLPGEGRAYDNPSDAQLSPLPLSLFAVCRVVNEELTQLLYGENRFAVTRRAPRGLKALERFRDSTIAVINFLVVRVNLASCRYICCAHPERRCGNGYFTCANPGSHDAPLGLASATDQTIISQWQRICRRWSKTVRPGQLSLYVICDCESRQTVDMIVNPLLALPILQDCGLRLASQHVEELQSLARKTTLYLTGCSPPDNVPHFRFLDLPREVQLHILEQTMLVQRCEILCGQDRMRCPGSCPVNGMVSGYANTNTTLLSCFCCRGHSAFNFSCGDVCASLGFPSALFLVCHALREAAMEVFYGSNEFTVSMVHPLLSHDNPAPGDGTSSIVPGLKRFPKGSIPFFTSLKLEFEPSGHDMLTPNQQGWKNWVNTIDLLSKEANPAILNLEIRLTENFFVSVWDLRQERDSAYEKRMWDTHEAFIQPLATLRGLKNFFVHLNWSTSCGIPGTGVPDGRQVVEQKLERLIMGEAYDSWKCGKKLRMDITGCQY